MTVEGVPRGGRGVPRGGPAQRLLFRVAAFAAGALGFLAFPAPGLDYLSWMMLVPGLLLIRAAPTWSEAALRGWLAGTGFLVTAQYWLAPNLTVFFPLVMAFLGLLWSGWGVLVRALLRSPVTAWRACAAVLGVPAGWVLIETARSWQWLGGPWGLLGATQWRHPAVLGLAAIGGVWLVSFAIVAANVGIALLITGRRPAQALGAAAALAGVVAGPAWYVTRPDLAVSEVARVALVQPGLSPGASLDREERLTAQLPGPVDLVVWGESSVGYDLAARPDILARLTRLSRIVGADILVDVDARSGSGGIAKTAILLDGAGIRDSYQKTRLVPFGEYVPFRGELGWLSRITKAAGENRRPGHRLVIMDVHGLAVGPLTSFEETFPDMARTQANHGAELIVYQSATSTFQGSWAPAQLATFGALRAAETGRPVVQAARTGVSAGYDAHGRRLSWIGASAREATIVDVPVANSSTPYDHFGNYVPVLSGAVLALLSLTTIPRRARHRRPQHAARPFARSGRAGKAAVFPAERTTLTPTSTVAPSKAPRIRPLST